MISRNSQVEEVVRRSVFHRRERIRPSYVDGSSEKGCSSSVIVLLQRNGRFDVVSLTRGGAEFVWRRLNVYQVNLLLERHSPSLVVYQGAQLPRLVLNTARRFRHLVYRPFGRAILPSIVRSDERLASLSLRGVQRLLSLSATLEGPENSSMAYVEVPDVERKPVIEALLTFTGDIEREIRLADATLDSLSTFWRRDEPLVLNVVAEERSLQRLERDLIRVPNVELCFIGIQRDDKKPRGASELYQVADRRGDYALCLRPGDFLASRVTNRTFSLAANTTSLQKIVTRGRRGTGGRRATSIVGAREVVGSITKIRRIRDALDVEPIGGPFVVSPKFVRMLLVGMPAVFRMENVSAREIVDSCTHAFGRAGQPNLRVIGNLAELRKIAAQSKSELWNYEGPPIFVSLPFVSQDVEAVVALLYLLLPQ